MMSRTTGCGFFYTSSFGSNIKRRSGNIKSIKHLDAGTPLQLCTNCESDLLHELPVDLEYTLRLADGTPHIRGLPDLSNTDS